MRDVQPYDRVAMPAAGKLHLRAIIERLQLQPSIFRLAMSQSHFRWPCEMDRRMIGNRQTRLGNQCRWRSDCSRHVPHFGSCVSLGKSCSACGACAAGEAWIPNRSMWSTPTTEPRTNIFVAAALSVSPNLDQVIAGRLFGSLALHASPLLLSLRVCRRSARGVEDGGAE
jgi:hypothetical protein